ncbi:helix-turn-helix transcriptional regulator [Acrocarpospora sp. B8E8]|uniref:helix-turn-helix domain-containing protein n=1 Tax=Acrocarpospora sp. B8E8 TaxID=3153572 RepID=UPI00325C6B56
MTATRVTPATRPSEGAGATKTGPPVNVVGDAAQGAHRGVQARAIGVRIRAAREARGWTQTDLADRTGYTQATISRWEGGHRDITAIDLLRVADALGVTAADLLPKAHCAPEGITP